MKVGSKKIILVSWSFFMRPFDVNNNENALFPCLFKVYFKIFVENIDDRTVIFRNLTKFIFFKYFTTHMDIFCAIIAENSNKINQYT